MNNNDSRVKSNQSRNFSSVATFENSSSQKSSPFRDLYILHKERMIFDPKFTNENIFEKQSGYYNNINDTFNMKPQKSSLYLTGLEESNDIKSVILKQFYSESNNHSNILKKNKRVIVKNKLSADSFPYILTTNNNYKSTKLSPLFSCCNQELNPKILNKVLCKQQSKEGNESKYRLCKTVENTKKLIVNPRQSSPKGVVVRLGPKNYIDKMREINRLKYCIDLKNENIKEFNYNIKGQINSIDYTINSLKLYKNNLENNFLNDFIMQLRKLNQIVQKERLEQEKLRNQLVKLKKDNYNLLTKIRKNELNKSNIEKWIGLQIYIKDNIKVDEKNIANYINKNYNGKLIIETTEDFDDLFKKKEIKSIRLIEHLNHSNEENISLFKQFKKIKENLGIDQELIKSILEREKLLSLLKMRNNDLVKEKKEAIRLCAKPKNVNSSPTNTGFISHRSFFKNNNERSNKNKNEINFNVIYSYIQDTFNYIITNDKESISGSQEPIDVIKIMTPKSTKALAQMRVIEFCFTRLNYYKETHIKGHEKLYKKLLEEIDISHKRAKAEKHKNEEQLKAIELFKKLQAKREKIIFKPTHQDVYSSNVYVEKIKREARKKTKKVKKEIDIYDFLHDLDDNEKEEEDN